MIVHERCRRLSCPMKHGAFCRSKFLSNSRFDRVYLNTESSTSASGTPRLRVYWPQAYFLLRSDTPCSQERDHTRQIRYLMENARESQACHVRTIMERATLLLSRLSHDVHQIPRHLIEFANSDPAGFHCRVFFSEPTKEALERSAA
jgi:hypothetical protein